MLVTSSTLADVEAAAQTAHQRLGAMSAHLLAVAAALERGARETDWQSESAGGFHRDVEELRVVVVQLRRRVDALASRVARARLRLAGTVGVMRDGR